VPETATTAQLRQDWGLADVAIWPPPRRRGLVAVDCGTRNARGEAEMHAEHAFGTSSAVQAGEDREIDGETTTALHRPWQVVYTTLGRAGDVLGATC
jgi:hypothetical protein